MAPSASRSDHLVVGRRRIILLTAGVAGISLTAGVAAAGRVVSPREAAARREPPEPGVITAPVEMRIVRNVVVTRGEVVYEGAADIALSTAGLESNPVVTGQVPRVGDTVEAGQVILQVVGRPVVALPGSVPTYRTLSPGSAGPDVLQLKAALVGLGLDPGNTASDLYDQQTAAAVAALYTRIGYTPPVADESLLEEMRTAQETVTTAEEEVVAAQGELDVALQPIAESERLEADAAVTSAQWALTGAQVEGDPVAIAESQSQLAIAVARRDELLAPRTAPVESATLGHAQGRLDTARFELAELGARAATRLPAAEVVFVSNLPRRVDAVHVISGGAVNGPVLRLSGTDVVVLASLGTVDAQLVTAGLGAELDLGDSTGTGTVLEVRDVVVPEGEEEEPDPEAPRREAVVRPDGVTPAQVEQIRGQNLRVTIPVQSSDGEVLAVPLAAMTAGPSGEARVEVQRSGGSVERVEVEVGLSAGGFAEIRNADGPLRAGDRVVVGQ